MVLFKCIYPDALSFILGVELVPDDASLGPVYPTPEQSGAGGIFGWFSGSQIVNKVMEKTKVSVR